MVLDQLSTEELLQACAQQASRRGASSIKPEPCYELFRRALGEPPDQVAWQAILRQYERLVLYWLGQYGDDDTSQEVFFRFWQAQKNALTPFSCRFSSIKSVMQYLKRCAVSVRIESHRKESLREELLARLAKAELAELIVTRSLSVPWAANFDLKQKVLSRLKDEKERAVFDATYRRGLPPREIQAERPDLFSNTRSVHRVKENLLKRLGRDPTLAAEWAARQTDEGYGGKADDEYIQ
jgi:DNA-directed RNA polymerase specialized sigma24 family protein